MIGARDILFLGVVLGGAATLGAGLLRPPGSVPDRERPESRIMSFDLLLTFRERADHTQCDLDLSVVLMNNTDLSCGGLTCT